MSNLMRVKSLELNPEPYRRLQSQIPKRCHEYAKKLRLLWSHHKITRKICWLQEMEKKLPITRSILENMLNSVDLEIGNFLRSAEKGCCNIRRHAVNDWSIEFAKLLKNERKTLIYIKKITI